MVADNIDNLESTMTGSGTSYRVNSILVTMKAPETNQEVEEGEEEYCRPTKENARDLLFLLKQSQVTFPIIMDVNVSDLASLTNKEFITKLFLLEFKNIQRLRYIVWIEVRKLKTHPTLLVSGWTTFNIKVANNVVITARNISYLDTIDALTTDWKTAVEVLCRACEIRDRLGLKAVAYVFYQSFYAKAMEVFWKNRDLPRYLVIMMGGFHLLMMLLGIIGHRFGNAGLAELAVESDIVAGGSIEKILSSKNYNRAIRIQKILYEALIWLLINASKSSLSEDQRNLVESKTTSIEKLKLNLGPEKNNFLLERDDIQSWYDLLKQFVDDLSKNGSDLSKSWLSYLELGELQLNLVFSIRSGDCEPYLACVEEVTPWTFAYD